MDKIEVKLRRRVTTIVEEAGLPPRTVRAEQGEIGELVGQSRREHEMSKGFDIRFADGRQVRCAGDAFELV